MEKIIGNYKIVVDLDENPENPREGWYNLGTMVCFYNRYRLGDKHTINPNDYNNFEHMKEELIKSENIHTILPLYLYDHSGITISTEPFSCSWDSGQIGWIFVSKEKVKEELIEDDKVENYLKGEVETYDQYLRGEVYYFEVYKVETCNLGHTHQELIDSCYGFYDKDQCMEEAECFVDGKIHSSK